MSQVSDGALPFQPVTRQQPQISWLARQSQAVPSWSWNWRILQHKILMESTHGSSRARQQRAKAIFKKHQVAMDQIKCCRELLTKLEGAADGRPIFAVQCTARVNLRRCNGTPSPHIPAMGAKNTSTGRDVSGPLDMTQEDHKELYWNETAVCSSSLLVDEAKFSRKIPSKIVLSRHLFLLRQRTRFTNHPFRSYLR